MKPLHTRRRAARWLRRAGAALLALLLVGLVPGQVYAFETRNAETIVIAADETVENDLVIRASEFTLDGTVNGNLTVYADRVLVNGDVLGNLVVVGDTLTLNGDVTGTLTAGGREVTIGGSARNARVGAQFVTLTNEASIARSLHVGAATLTQQEGSTIGTDLVFVGIYAAMLGEVGGNRASPASPSNGDADDSTPPPATPAPTAPANTDDPGTDDATATPRNEDERTSNAGNIQLIALMQDHTPQAQPAAAPLAQDDATGESAATANGGALLTWLAETLRRFASVSLIGIVLLSLLPTMVRGASDKLVQRPVLAAGLGVVAIPVLLLFPIILVFAITLLFMLFSTLTLEALVSMTLVTGAISVIGTVVAVTIIIVYVGHIVTGYTVGTLYLQRVKPEWAGNRYIPMLIGVLLFSILRGMPVIGFGVGLISTLLGLGALWLYWTRRPSEPIPALVGEVAPRPTMQVATS